MIYNLSSYININRKDENSNAQKKVNWNIYLRTEVILREMGSLLHWPRFPFSVSAWWDIKNSIRNGIVPCAGVCCSYAPDSIIFASLRSKNGTGPYYKKLMMLCSYLVRYSWKWLNEWYRDQDHSAALFLWVTFFG